MISEERVEKAVEFIRDHSESLGGLIGRCKALEQKRKVVYGQEFLAQGGKGTVAEREAAAYSSKDYRLLVEEIEDAWAEKSTLETHVLAAQLTIDVWRSQNSAKNKGHL